MERAEIELRNIGQGLEAGLTSFAANLNSGLAPLGKEIEEGVSIQHSTNSELLAVLATVEQKVGKIEAVVGSQRGSLRRLEETVEMTSRLHKRILVTPGAIEVLGRGVLIMKVFRLL